MEPECLSLGLGLGRASGPECLGLGPSCLGLGRRAWSAWAWASGPRPWAFEPGPLVWASSRRAWAWAWASGPSCLGLRAWSAWASGPGDHQGGGVGPKSGLDEP